MSAFINSYQFINQRLRFELLRLNYLVLILPNRWWNCKNRWWNLNCPFYHRKCISIMANQIYFWSVWRHRKTFGERFAPQNKGCQRKFVCIMVFIKVQEKQNLHPKIRRIILTSSLGADQEHFGYHSGYRNFAGIKKNIIVSFYNFWKIKIQISLFCWFYNIIMHFITINIDIFFLPFRNAQVKKVTAWLCKKKA